jgi:glycosyltransferase involved in cell wall biosynthesis
MELSVIIPLYNEANNIHDLIQQLTSVIQTMNYATEIIFIDDGSSDNSLEQLKLAATKNKLIKIIELRRNYGQTAAMMAGIDYASGKIIIAMDGDLQNDPADIPQLIKKIEEGYDVASGWRKKRKDNYFLRNLPSKIANKLISWISGVKLHDYGCSLKAYRKNTLKNIKLYGEMHRFIPIYARWQGAKVIEIPVNHRARKHGKSKYGLERIAKVMLDLLVVKFLDKSLTKPIYTFGGFGLICFMLALLSGCYSIFLKITQGLSFILTPLPLLTAMLILIGIMSILLGLLAEIVVRTYFEAQDKRIYAVKGTTNLEKD